MTSALHTCDSPEWYTPATIVEAAREVMGGIDLDPASHEEANRTVKATRYYTEADNGLVQPWEGRVFLNPPGGLVNEFWRKLVENYPERVMQAVWIGYSLEQLQTLQSLTPLAHPLEFAMCIPARRIAFVENEAKCMARMEKLRKAGKRYSPISSPSHANYITYMGADYNRFHTVFGKFGIVT